MPKQRVVTEGPSNYFASLHLVNPCTAPQHLTLIHSESPFALPSYPLPPISIFSLSLFPYCISLTPLHNKTSNLFSILLYAACFSVPTSLSVSISLACAPPHPPLPTPIPVEFHFSVIALQVFLILPKLSKLLSAMKHSLFLSFTLSLCPCLLLDHGCTLFDKLVQISHGS